MSLQRSTLAGQSSTVSATAIAQLRKKKNRFKPGEDYFFRRPPFKPDRAACLGQLRRSINLIIKALRVAFREVSDPKPRPHPNSYTPSGR
jgi:hypothetical protein